MKEEQVSQITSCQSNALKHTVAIETYFEPDVIEGVKNVLQTRMLITNLEKQQRT